MADLGNKKVLAKNLQYYMDINNVTRQQLCEQLGIKYSTLSEWLAANKYPRIDAIELLANYFKIQKSNLIEERKNSVNENKPDDAELEENIIIYNRNGKVIKKKMSKEKMEMLSSMLDAIPEDDNPDL